MDGKEEKNEVDAEQIRKDAQDVTLAKERGRIQAINEEFADDPGFANKAIEEGWSLAEAKGEYCTVLKEKLASKRKEKKAEGVPPIAGDGTDNADDSGDFIAEARELAATQKITKAEAMRRLKRDKPGAYAKFREQCETNGQQMYAEAG